MGVPLRLERADAKLKFCNKRARNDLADRISQLPDEILVLILSFLTVEEAVATSIISSRWKHLWKSITRLDFYGTKAKSQLSARRDLPDHVERLKYVEWVTHVLQLNESYTLDELKIRFDLPKTFGYAIDEWISVAITKRVSRLELNLSWCGKAIEPTATTYTFPSRILGVLSFKFLQALYLKAVEVIQEDLEYFLDHCPVLERLSVEGVGGFRRLQVTGLALPLKYLEITTCHDLRTIEIFNTNLVSFRFCGRPMVKLLLVNVPHLVEVSYTDSANESLNSFLSQLSCCLPQLRALTFTTFTRFMPIIELKPYLTFVKLKELVLNIWIRQGHNLLGYIPLIEASPCLESFVLKLRWSIPIPTSNEARRPVKCSPQYLKVVEFAGYRGTSDFELAMYLIDNAAALEKVIIDPRCQCEDDLITPGIFDEHTGRYCARQQLVGKVPSRVKLVIL